MRLRTLGALAALAAVIVGLPADAATKTLDGKKVKKISFSTSASGQVHDTDIATDVVNDTTTEDRLRCKPPRCFRQDFVFAPARGVKGNVVVAVEWGVPATDVDLYLVGYKNGKPIDVAHCGSFYGTGEKFQLPSTRLKAKQKYTIVVDLYRVPSDTVTGSVSFPAKFTSTAPAQMGTADGLGLPTACGWDGSM